jgi:hypothetical protein
MEEVAITSVSRPTATGAKVRRVSLRVRIVAYLLVVGVSLAALEFASYIYLRIVEGYDGKHLMTYEFDDYKNIQLTPGYRNSLGIYHNAQGFRRNLDTPKQKAPGVYRIFIMGGSTAYGLGSLSKYGQEKYAVIRNDETIDHYLEEYLADKLKDLHVEVINAAITSQMSHHHLIYLNQTILKYHPDMIVFIDGFNDYYPYEKGFDQFRDYAYQERAHRFMQEPTIGAWLGYSGWWLFRKSHFVYVASKALRPVWLSLRGIGRVRNRIKVDEALTNLQVNAKENFVKIVERNALILKHEGVVPVFTVQPEIVFRQSKNYTEMERKIFAEMSDHWQENYVEYKNRARPVVLDAMKRATSQTGAYFFDLTDPFGGLNEDAYTDYCHLTPMGNRRLAYELGAKILPLISAGSRSELQVQASGAAARDLEQGNPRGREATASVRANLQGKNGHL